MRIKTRRIVTNEELPFPVPTRTVPADESEGPHQSENQRRVERLAADLTQEFSTKLGMGRRQFLSSGSGMAVVFMAMNSVFGRFFFVDPAEASDPAIAQERNKALSGQFIFDVQTHCVSPTYRETLPLDLRERAKSGIPS